MAVLGLTLLQPATAVGQEWGREGAQGVCRLLGSQAVI